MAGPLTSADGDLGASIINVKNVNSSPPRRRH
jgi:hypothetical protein